jgi:hypothetical protein
MSAMYGHLQVPGECLAARSTAHDLGIYALLNRSLKINAAHSFECRCLAYYGLQGCTARE